MVSEGNKGMIATEDEKRKTNFLADIAYFSNPDDISHHGTGRDTLSTPKDPESERVPKERTSEEKYAQLVKDRQFMNERSGDYAVIINGTLCMVYDRADKSKKQMLELEQKLREENPDTDLLFKKLEYITAQQDKA